MEVPGELKELYNHWNKHSNVSINENNSFSTNSIYKEIEYLINERMLIYEKKYKGETPPYSQDPILAKYRFCNIYRELDKQTILFHKLLKPLTADINLWLLNMAFCRFICNPSTIERIGLLSFDEEENKKVYKKLMGLTSPKYGSAYIFPISVIKNYTFNTREKFFCFHLPLVVKTIALELIKLNDASVVDALNRVLPIFKYNFKFHWTEILIDFAYQYPEHINLFKDFPIGPGSKPTMLSLKKDQSPEETCMQLSRTLPKNFNYLTFNLKPVYLSTENWEGIGCEYRKYHNLKLGFGRKRYFN